MVNGQPMKSQTFASVWDALEQTPQQAQNMRLRSELMLALKQHIQDADLSQTQAARLFGVTQPRISDLMRGKINLFGLDALVNMALAAGLQVQLQILEIDRNAHAIPRPDRCRDLAHAV